MRCINADELEPDTDYDDGEYFAYSKAQIENAPTIEPERKTGKWILHKDGSGTCDQCRFTQIAVWDYDGWQNFCGHCGAKMDGGEQDAV